jgi:hypothetical protein
MADKPILIVMRLANMHRVHPKQIESVCARCGHVVAIYPSGQTALRHFGAENVEIVCEVCHFPGPDAVALPGVVEESRESKPKREPSDG